jgi:hypothetical protein
MFGLRKRKKSNREILEEFEKNATDESRNKRDDFYVKQLQDGQRVLRYFQEGHLRGDYLGARAQFGGELAEVQNSIVLALLVQNAELQKRLEKLEGKQ